MLGIRKFTYEAKMEERERSPVLIPNPKDVSLAIGNKRNLRVVMQKKMNKLFEGGIQNYIIMK